MNIVANEKLIKRNARIGQITSLVSLAILGGGMYITFTQPEKFSLSMTALLLGFLLSQIGIYFTNRWGRTPRIDQQLSQALKGLDKQYNLYHYTTPASHLLLGPAGIWVIIPKTQRGKIVYEKNRWRQKGGGLLMGYLKIFAQEGIGRPDLEILSETEAVKRYIEDKSPDLSDIQVNALLVFTNPETTIDADDAPFPTLQASKLKDFIRKTAKTKPITQTQLDKLKGIFPA